MTTNDINMLPRIPQEWMPYTPIIMGLGRTLLAALGSAGCTWAYAVTASQMEMVVGAGMILVAGGWSAYQKFKSQRALGHAAASPAGVPPPALPM